MSSIAPPKEPSVTDLVAPPLSSALRVPCVPGDATDAIPAPVLAEGTSRVATLAPAVEARGIAPRTFAQLLVALSLLNVFDALMTLWAVRLGVATEANPLMAAALELGEPVFLASKMAIVAAGCAVLWSARHRRIAQTGTCVCLAVYVALAVVHLGTAAHIAAALRAVA